MNRIWRRKRHILRVIVEYAPENTYKAAALLTLDGDTEACGEDSFGRTSRCGGEKGLFRFSFYYYVDIYRTFQERLSEKMREELEKAMCGFRYWIDEPGDDVMWFFSENHALLFHCLPVSGGKFPAGQNFYLQRENRGAVSARGEELLREWFEGFSRSLLPNGIPMPIFPWIMLGLGTLYKSDGAWKRVPSEGEEGTGHDLLLAQSKCT